MTEAVIETETASRKLAGKYLTFTIQGESYGVEVLKVREIIRHLAVTAVPQMPDHICGVINLRGKIIPVMDLRRRFDFPDIANTESTCIVVVQVHLPGGTATITAMGMVVDGVEEVINFNEADIEVTPNFGGNINTGYIVGIAKVRDKVKLLLDIDRILAGDSF